MTTSSKKIATTARFVGGAVMGTRTFFLRVGITHDKTGVFFDVILNCIFVFIIFF